MAARNVTIFGGSGFIGRYLVQRLARQGWTIRVAVRHPDRALFLKPMGAVGQITRDHLYYMERVGFDAFELREGEEAEEALAAFDAFPAWYQR